MSFFISDAMAQSGGGQDPGFLGLLPLILIFVIFYFLLMRPQIKRAKEHRKMVETLSKNDEVATSGGIMGRITKVDEQFVVLEVADGIRLRFQRGSVASLLPKGTLKDASSKSDDDDEKSEKSD